MIIWSFSFKKKKGKKKKERKRKEREKKTNEMHCFARSFEQLSLISPKDPNCCPHILSPLSNCFSSTSETHCFWNCCSPQILQLISFCNIFHLAPSSAFSLLSFVTSLFFWPHHCSMVSVSPPESLVSLSHFHLLNLQKKKLDEQSNGKKKSCSRFLKANFFYLFL